METHMTHSYTPRWRLYCAATKTPLDAGGSHNIRLAGWCRRMQLAVRMSLGLTAHERVTDAMLADHLELAVMG